MLTRAALVPPVTSAAAADVPAAAAAGAQLPEALGRVLKGGHRHDRDGFWRGKTAENCACTFLRIPSEQYRAREQQEGRAIEDKMLLKSEVDPHIVRWLRRPFHDAGAYMWLTCEPLGKTLRQLLKGGGWKRHPERRVLEVCQAVHALHKRWRRAHGGITLDCFVKGESGQLQLLGRGTHFETSLVAAAGSVIDAFTTPEALARLAAGSHGADTQAEQQRPSRREDVFRLGLVLWYIATGMHPFDRGGSSTDDLLSSIRTDGHCVRTRHLASSSVCGHKRFELVHLVRAMLHPDPKKRCASSPILTQSLTALTRAFAWMAWRRLAAMHV